jgi:hypothetical protein
MIESGDGNALSRNAIFANGSRGIALGDSSTPPANDPGDGDTGANDVQNHPVLASAKGKGKKGKTTVISGALNSKPNRTYLIELFANPTAGGPEGQIHLESREVTTDGDGNAAFTFTTKRRLGGQAITATATDSTTGDTSEFSAAVKVKKSKKDKKGKKGKGRAASQTEAASGSAAKGERGKRDGDKRHHGRGKRGR